MYKKTINLPVLLKAFQMLGFLGPWLFLEKFRYQVFSRTPNLCVGKELDQNGLAAGSPGTVKLSAASPADVQQFFRLMAAEGKQSRYAMLDRKGFYEKGFDSCYIGRTIESDEMASITWLVSPADVKKTGSEHRYHFLKKDEMMAENIFTLEKFRGKGVMDATGRQEEAIAAAKGFKRILCIIREDNIPSLKSCMRRGHLIYRRLMISHILFHVKVEITDNYNPPVPISIRDQYA